MEDLQWQQTIPEKLAWYWVYRKGLPQPKLAQIFADGTKADGKPALRYSFHETQMSSHALGENSGLWFYGPVQDPPKKPE